MKISAAGYVHGPLRYAPLAIATVLLSGLVGCASRPPLDAARLKTGHFSYRTMIDDKEAGGATISVARTDAQSYRFTNEVTGQFRQSWESIASARLEPRSATLGLGANDSPARTMRLVYDQHSVTGTTTKSDPANGVQTANVSAQLPSDIVDQRIDWAALMSAAWQPGRTVRFSVYDPWTGTSPLTARLLANEEVRVPAGAFAALHIVYRIEKKTRGTEQYEIWVSETLPRFLVREHFPNGATTELVRVSE